MNSRRLTRTVVITAALGLALLSVAPLAAQARGRGGPPPTPEQAVERITRHVQLTGEQQEKVQAILEESFAQRREMSDQHRQESDVLREATENRLAEVLSAEQREELREVRELRKERRDGRRDGRRDCDRYRECWNDGGSVED